MSCAMPMVVWDQGYMSKNAGRICPKTFFCKVKSEKKTSKTCRFRKVKIWNTHNAYLRGGFNYVFNFHPYFGKIPILANSFQRVWNHQLDILHESSFVYSTICPAVLSCHRNNICLSFFEFLEPKRNNRNSTGWWAYSLSLHILFSVGWWFEIRILSWIHGVRHGKYFNSLFFWKIVI